MSRLRHEMPPLSALLPFEAAARLGSFKQAAQELHLTQAAISRRIRALEENLGTALFTRHHRAVQLTEAGQQFFVTASAALEEIAGEAGRLRQLGTRREVVLFAELYIAMYWLVPRLADFHRRHPQITIRLSASSLPLTRAGERFDLALQCSDRPSGLLTPHFSVADIVQPVCSPSLADADSLALEQLMALPLLHFSQQRGDSWMDWPQWLDHRQWHGSVPEGRHFDSYTVILEAAMAGQGVALGWRLGIERLIERGDLVCPVKEHTTLDNGLSVYLARHRTASEDVAAVSQWLATQLAACAA
ncbi:LysR substrate-binding domain-containing protein [Kushneria aurantia]|uniref:LysR substrate-binding domain-containing protein n=1 Tax=Kushneria aurantia TaxID=504092 RepID=A0ABV6G1B1_9GAMM|nr:LysR substrate-binding domain-containing protein [Kushneria aurantia]